MKTEEQLTLAAIHMLRLFLSAPPGAKPVIWKQFSVLSWVLGWELQFCHPNCPDDCYEVQCKAFGEWLDKHVEQTGNMDGAREAVNTFMVQLMSGGAIDQHGGIVKSGN